MGEDVTCDGSPTCPAATHIFGCLNGPGWREEPLRGGDAHPHWCKCQRVCGGDQ